MKLIPHEKEIDKHDRLILTNKRLIKDSAGSFNKETIEFPLEKLDSISFAKKGHPVLIVIGIILFVFSYFLSQSLFAGMIPFLMIILGIVSIILGLLWRKQVVAFKSNTETIFTEKRNVDKFIEKVREAAF